MKESNAKGNALRRVLLVALLPLTILFWMTGWTFYWLEDQRAFANVARKEAVTAARNEDWQNSHKHKATPQPIFN